MLESLVTSKTRIKLLLKFFINPGTITYLRELSNEFGDSTNSIRVELNRLSKADLLVTENSGRTILYKANTKHSFFKDLQRVAIKYVGIDQLIEEIVSKLGDVRFAYVIGDYAKGVDSGIIDLILIGKIKKQALNRLTEKTEKIIKRKIRTIILTQKEFKKLSKTLDIEHSFLIWNGDL